MTVEQIKEMKPFEVCMELECGNLLDQIDTVDKAQAILDKVSCLRRSQGFYTRLCESLEDFIASFDDDSDDMPYDDGEECDGECDGGCSEGED